MQTYPLVHNSPTLPPPPKLHQNWPLKPSVPGQPALPLHPPAVQNNIILVIDLKVMQTKQPSVNKSTIRCTFTVNLGLMLSLIF